MSAPAPAFDAAVLIGRFQPFHLGHAELLQHALALAQRCVVVIGSAFQARTPKNPFTWPERAEMIRLAVPEAERARLLFLPMRDYYDEPRWAAEVRRGLAGLLGTQPVAAGPIALVGHFKDASSEYLRAFPGWSLQDLPRSGEIDGVSIRNAWFGCGGSDLDATLAALVSQASPATLAFLRASTALPHFAMLAEEWRLLRDYRQAWSTAPYPPVFVTVDSVVQCAGHVLLVRRGQAPGKGLSAVPGGFIELRETTWQSALRELREETRLDLLAPTMQHRLKAKAVFDHPDRSQRGRTITHAFHFDLGERELPEVEAGDDAAAVQWVPVPALAAMEDRFLDDHFHMLDHFLGLTSPG